ncbi:DUF2750 domain-containing protein [Enterovibrio sp. ZSDZ35]|uniref:DUF2750 domain-containing protein n=1 Tax=Enterovibrio qingdaonensis TaxID=2899818 RepID=A0ABT5QI62_9GAMM|nr:DUF2750 domain-containing protein [Enterovibrio sp. ZSDZ35]MDD1780363.1 DUF2750 domain-containing protein [Enterovibrio sp. ZSDZ35]
MIQDQATSNKNYERFLARVSESLSIWGLQHPDGGWAICRSNQYESTSVYVFWSDEAYANRVAVGEWSDYQPTKIHLDSFIGNWLKGLHSDGHLVGLNWDANLCGQEKEPIDVAKALTSS